MSWCCTFLSSVLWHCWLSVKTASLTGSIISHVYSHCVVVSLGAVQLNPAKLGNFVILYLSANTKLGSGRNIQLCQKKLYMRTLAWEHGVRASSVFWSFLSVTFGTWLTNLCSMCVHVLYFQQNVACWVVDFGFASTHLLVDLWAGGGHVIASLLEPQFSQQFRRLFLALNHRIQPSESAGHVFNVCRHCLIFTTCSYQRSSLAYMEQFPTELCSFDVIGFHTSRH